MKIKSIFLFVYTISLISIISFSSASLNFGYNNREIPALQPGINYSLIPTVNSSDFWDLLDTPADIPGSEYWHNQSIEALGRNVDLLDYDFGTGGEIYAQYFTGSGAQLTNIEFNYNHTIAVNNLYGKWFHNQSIEALGRSIYIDDYDFITGGEIVAGYFTSYALSNFNSITIDGDLDITSDLGNITMEMKNPKTDFILKAYEVTTLKDVLKWNSFKGQLSTVKQFLAGTGNPVMATLTGGTSYASFRCRLSATDSTRKCVFNGAPFSFQVYSVNKMNVTSTGASIDYSVNPGVLPLRIYGNDSNSISLWVDKNVSATGYITRTSTFDSTKNPFDYIKNSSYYIDNGEINHSKFYGYVSYDVPDFTKPYSVPMIEYVEQSDGSIIEVPYNDIRHKLKKEEGVSLGYEADLFRQSIYELKEENQILKDALCTLGSFEFCGGVKI